MSLLHSDGFDSHATGAATLADGDPNWGAQVGVSINATGGKFGGKSLRLASSTTGSLTFTASGTNMAFAGWFKVGALTNPLILLADATHSLVVLNVDRSVSVNDGGGTLRVTMPAGTIPVDTYVWLEASYRSGGVNANANGAPIGTPYVGAYTAPVGPFKLLNAVNTDAAGVVDVDDFIVWDDQGSFFNAYGLSRRRIQLLRPNADGAAVAWVPNGATNWQSADAADWAGGAGNVATAAGQADRLAFTDMTASPGSIDAVVVKTRSQNTGSDPATLAHTSATGVTVVSDTAQTVPTSPGVLRSNFYRDTANAPWTTATVNANEFGYTLGV